MDGQAHHGGEVTGMEYPPDVIGVVLTALTPETAVAYLKCRAAEVGQKTLDMGRQAILAMMVYVIPQLPPGATLASFRLTRPSRLVLAPRR